jgi:hypothetical protein
VAVNLGIAMAKIGVNLSQFKAGRDQVVAQSREMEVSLGRVGKTADNTAKQLGGIGKSLQGIKGVLVGLGLTGFLAQGVQAARTVAGINTQFRIMLGSEQAANKELASIREQARRTGQGFLDLAGTAGQLLNLSRAAGTPVQKLVTLSQQLQAVDPTARAFDVAIALREFALQGQTLSLLRRFELPIPKVELQQIAALKDTTARIEGLQAALTKIGFGTELLEEFGKSGAFAFQELRSELEEAMGTAFQPFLQDVLLPLVRAGAEFLRGLRETNPELLKIVGTFTAVTAGVGVLLIVVTQLIGAFKQLQAVAALPRVGKALAGAARLGVGAVAVGAGVGGGLTLLDKLAQAGGTGGDLPRIRQEGAGNVIQERAQQLIVIVVSAIMKIVQAIATVLAGFVNVLKQGGELVAALKLIGNGLKVSSSSMSFGNCCKVSPRPSRASPTRPD